MQTFIAKILLISFIVAAAPASSLPAEPGWKEAGVRYGIQINSRPEYFRLYEAFAVYGLPWDWRHSSGWGLSTQLNTALGALDGKKETAFIGSLGTGVSLDSKGAGISMDLGVNANFLDRRQIGRQDFGSIVQFGSYWGINYCFENGLKISYRLQHLSNARIFYSESTPNPGLDMHMFGISKAF